MKTWDFNLSIDVDGPTPLFRQIARAIARDIAVGRLQPGDGLPGSRRLASELGVHRNTVVAAYEGLASEGWVVTRRAGGTYVAERAPDPTPVPFAPKPSRAVGVPARSGFALARLQAPTYGWQANESFTAITSRRTAPDVLLLSSGTPDWRLFPVEILARALRRVLNHHTAMALELGHPKGHPKARRAVATMLAARRGLLLGPENIITTRGCCMSLRLLAQTLLGPGDAVAVETPGYPAAWEALHAAGARLVPVEVDGDGLRLDLLQKALMQGNIRAVYITPHHQYPTTSAMSPSRRLALLQLAAEHRVAIIEDDYDHEFHYDGQPLRPLASADRFGVVVYMGSLSKLAAPGLRMGFVAGPTDLIERLCDNRLVYDTQGDLALELAIADLSEDGEISRHVRRVRPIYNRRRDALVHALRTHLPELEFKLPPGGLSLWVRLPGAGRMEAWAARCAAAGVVFFTSRRYAFDGQAGDCARLCFSTLNETQLEDAAKRMALSFP